MDWDDCKSAFYLDGSLRDICAANTTVTEWDRFLEFASQQVMSYFVGGEPKAIPKQASELFDKNSDQSHLLAIEFGNVILNCHFFTSEEVELDLDPKQVTSQQELDAIINVLTGIGKALDKDVILTDENQPASVWFKFDASTGRVAFTNLDNAY